MIRFFERDIMASSKPADSNGHQLATDAIRRHLLTLAEATEEIVNATGQAFYVWDIASDAIEWSRNFAALVGLKATEQRHLTGRKFESMLGSQSRETRFGAIVSAERSQVQEGPAPYQCIYVLQPDTESETQPLWIEDTGSWFPGPDGRPVRAEGTIRIINDRRQREEDLRRQSDFDDLTGLPNRRSLEAHIAKSIENSARQGIVSTLLILCIDRMDLINDIHGFATGDHVLGKVGEIIRSKLRTDDIVCRFSGAKFGIVLSDCPPAEIYDAGNRLLKAISADVLETPSGAIPVSAVIGACFLPKHADTPKQAIHAAMKASHSARLEAARRVSVYSHDPERDARADLKSTLSNRIVRAISENRIELAFQPVCRCDGSIAFHEALIQMRDEDGSYPDAGDLIVNAGELGLSRILDRQALVMVLDVLATYRDAKLSINISKDTILDPDWLSDLATGLAMTQDGAGRLVVEVSESMLISDPAETRRFFENLHALGCRVAIDKFGAGFSSFANLQELPVDLVKIEASFGAEWNGCLQYQAFIKALFGLARFHNMETVIEWNEESVGFELLADWDVDYHQGNRFGKPVNVPPWHPQPETPPTD
jgi:diguanylate cyclase (GGDEF)-like protein